MAETTFSVHVCSSKEHHWTFALHCTLTLCPVWVKTSLFGNVCFLFGRYLEAEGLEKTFKFKQKNIADVVDVTSARKVILLFCYVITRDKEMAVGWEGWKKGTAQERVQNLFKVAQNSFQHIPRLKFWWIIITTLYQLMLQSWYQKTAQLPQLLVNTLVLFFVTQ